MIPSIDIGYFIHPYAILFANSGHIELSGKRVFRDRQWICGISFCGNDDA